MILEACDFKSCEVHGYRYHQNGRDDVYPNVSDEDLKQDLIENFQKLSTIVILNNDVVI